MLSPGVALLREHECTWAAGESPLKAWGLYGCAGGGGQEREQPSHVQLVWKGSVGNLP